MLYIICAAIHVGRDATPSQLYDQYWYRDPSGSVLNAYLAPVAATYQWRALWHNSGRG